MRIRTIKPDFFKDEQLAEVGPYARLLFIGLWLLADRDGRLEDRPKRIEAEVLPYNSQDVNALLQELADHKEHFIIRYEVDGKKIIQIRTFTKHQRINGKEAEAASILPKCEATGKQSGSNGEATGKQRGSSGEATEKQLGSNGEEPPQEKHKPTENIDKTEGEAVGKQWGSNGEAVETDGKERKGKEGKGKEGQSEPPPPPPEGLLSQVKRIKAIRPEFEALREVDIENALAGCPEEFRASGISDFIRDMVETMVLPDNPVKKLRGYLNRAIKDGTTATPRGTYSGIENLSAEDLIERANDALAKVGK